LGLWAADKINTVSPSYAEEILTPDFGAGLHDFLNTRRKDIFGILNGLDLNQWDPEKDQDIYKNFSRKMLVDRKENKRQLQLDLDLAPNPSIPLLSFIGRMDHQKGVEFAIDALDQIQDIPWQAVFLGTGDSSLENLVRKLAEEIPNKVRVLLRYDSKMARRIYAGADMIMIPSRYEPCGLVQMIGMRYGCVPVARLVGGLRDTIVDYESERDSNGFLYNDPTPESIVEALLRALDVFKDKRRWRGLQLRGMGRDFSWHKSANQYLDLYQLILGERQ
jgi:starch synthase